MAYQQFLLSIFLIFAFIVDGCLAFTTDRPIHGRGGMKTPSYFASASKPIIPFQRRFSQISSLASTNGSTNIDETEQNDKNGQSIQDKISAFTEMALPYYKESSAGRWLFAGMIGMTLLNSGVSVAFSYVGKDFWNALNSKDTEQFYTMLWRYAGALLVGSPVSVLYSFQRERLAVSWREWMTDRCLQLYSSNRVYYNLERGSEIDNPDQRIT